MTLDPRQSDSGRRIVVTEREWDELHERRRQVSALEAETQVAWDKHAAALLIIDELLEAIDGFIGTGKASRDPYWLDLLARIEAMRP